MLRTLLRRHLPLHRLILCSGLRHQRILRILLHKRDQALERPVPVIIDEIARTGGLELDRREPCHAERYGGGEIVFGCFHLGDEEAVADVFEAFAEGVPGGFQALAVTAPMLGSNKLE